MAHKTDEELIEKTHNLSRFFTTHRQIAWVFLIASVLWGVFGYMRMPQRKDPDIPVRTALVVVPWPGVGAEKIERLVTKRIEEVVSQNAQVNKIQSVSRRDVSLVYVDLDEFGNADTNKEFDDVNQKLSGIHDLPAGAGPIQFVKDFGDTSALMLTVSSPLISTNELSLRTRNVRAGLETARRQGGNSSGRFSLVVVYPPVVSSDIVERPFHVLSDGLAAKGVVRNSQVLSGPGFVAIDGVSDLDDAHLLAAAKEYLNRNLQLEEIHPDAWEPVVIRDPSETNAKLATVAGPKYSYRELDDYTDAIVKSVKQLDEVSKVSRSGILPENVLLYYSQDRLANYGLQPMQLAGALSGRNTSTPGGEVSLGSRTMRVDPSGELKSQKDLNGVIVGASPTGAPVYLRDLVDVTRSYQSPHQFLNFFSQKDASGRWNRNRAITIAIQMRPGKKIGLFSKNVNTALVEARKALPNDLIFARTSDQPRQVQENVDLFMTSLMEAIVLVILVAWVGFWEWRLALLLAFCIPLTLAMTFGMSNMLGIDLQQVSIATLIIALGLLVDVPVVAGDAVKRELSSGQNRTHAAWIGPTRLATAILFATITNIVAYLPFLAVGGNTGRFIYSLPVVMTCSLVASFIVAITFLPLLAFYVLKPAKAAPSVGGEKGFPALYAKIVAWCVEHRYKALALSVVFLALGGVIFKGLKQSFFPSDLQYLSTVDIWLPEDASTAATDKAAHLAEDIIRRVADKFAKEHDGKDPLESVTTFVGGGGPRFWFSLPPEMQQPNYAQIIVQVKDRHDTSKLVKPVQDTLTAELAGARCDVRQLETGANVGVPVSFRVTGPDAETLRSIADQVKAIYRKTPLAQRIRDDWGAAGFQLNLRTDSDRANLSGVTNDDVAISSAMALSGVTIGTLREDDKQIPIVARLRPEERSTAGDLQNLYVFSTRTGDRVPLSQVATVEPKLEPVVIRRRNQARTITVSCYPAEGHLPSEITKVVEPEVMKLAKTLPPGYRIQVGGELEKQREGFLQLAVVLLISVAMIYIALAYQFKSAIKPLIVFAAVPFGTVGSFIALWVMGQPFGFMAFLGVASLVGVIVSHIIVLFDFIEEAHEKGKALEPALVEAGLQRLRPIMITVAATIIALFPLASHGGPLWEPLCYAQIGGLAVATFVTLLLVPTIYAIFVYDLKIVKWDHPEEEFEGE